MKFEHLPDSSIEQLEKHGQSVFGRKSDGRLVKVLVGF